jgi:starch-binding outer membrane protein, SusD/RagB family
MTTLHRIMKLSCLICVFVAFSCDDFVQVDPPRTDLVRATVFTSDKTAEAAVIDIYYGMKEVGFASGQVNSISAYGALSSDELRHYNRPLEDQQFNDNTLQANNRSVSGLWSSIYSTIYKANAVIEGLASSTAVTANFKKQLEGEAKFIRAFCHFYLVNLWGDVPLILTTDYEANNSAPLAPKAQVYQQIILDLKEAQSLLSNDYSFSKNERVRANRGASTALLARVYLYTEDWANAEAQATAVITNALYSLELNLVKVFRTTSPEAIFQLWHLERPLDRNTFNVLSTGPTFGSLRLGFINGFEVGDQRWAIWGRSRVVTGITYYYPLKYASFTFPPEDYSTVLRVAEQYLIRAEARAKQNKLPEAAADINRIRSRAGLAPTTATTQAAMLTAIEQERRSEFFTEWGHRWLDLKRTGRADAVLGPIKPQWDAGDVFYPIPESQLQYLKGN